MFPAKHKGQIREVNYIFASEMDIRLAKSWSVPERYKNKPRIRDALEFSKLAISKWNYYQKHGSAATSIEDIKEYIEDNPRNEIAVCVVARASWYKQSQILGICLFRRTWCNNLIIDYLTAHPLSGENGDTKISGVGSGLMYFVATNAVEIKADRVWGEATQLSRHFYEKVLAIKNVTDLILAKKSRVNAFKKATDAEIQKFKRRCGKK